MRRTFWIAGSFCHAEDGIRDLTVTGVQTCALPICERGADALELTHRGSDSALGRPGSSSRAAHDVGRPERESLGVDEADRKSTRLNSSHSQISYAVFCLKKKKKKKKNKHTQ